MQQVAERIVSNTAGKGTRPDRALRPSSRPRVWTHCAKARPGLTRGRARRSSASTQDSVEAVAAHVDGAPAPRGPLRHPATVAVAVAIVVPWPESGAEGAESGADEERSDEATMAEKGGPCERPPDERPANERPANESRPADEAGPTDEAGTPHEGGPAGEARPADEAAAESADARSAETAAAKSTHATAGEASSAESAAAEASATESAAAAKAACARVSRIGRHHGGDETNGGERDRHLAQHVDFLLSPPQQRRDCKSPLR